MTRAPTEALSDALAARFFATWFALDPEVRALLPAGLAEHRRRLVDDLVAVVGPPDDARAARLARWGRQHRTHGLVPRHYDTAGAALLTTLRRTGADEAALRTWTSAWATAAAGMRAAAAAETGPASWRATVVSHERIGDGLAVVRLESAVPVPRRAGQHVHVQVPQRPHAWRRLSPATAADDELEVHVRAVPGGWVSPAIVRHTRVGDTWRVGPARGRLAVEGGRDVLMVAGGTGLAPLRSLVLDLARRGDAPRVHLFVGARTRAELHDLPLLAQVASANPWLTVVPVVEDGTGGAPWVDGGHAVDRGTVADVVSAHGSWADRQVLLSGPPAMVRATAAALLARGAPPENLGWDRLPG